MIEFGMDFDDSIAPAIFKKNIIYSGLSEKVKASSVPNTPTRTDSMEERARNLQNGRAAWRTEKYRK